MWRSRLLRQADEVREPVDRGWVERKNRFSVRIALEKARERLIFADLEHALPEAATSVPDEFSKDDALPLARRQT
jgi:hypothetical protein